MQLEDKLDFLFETLKQLAIDKFKLAGSIGTETMAIRPNMSPIRFDIAKKLLPLAMWPGGHKGYTTLDRAANLGLIIAAFIASEGNIDDHKRFDIKPDWANFEKPDFLWFELASRSYERYEAYHIDRSGPEPELKRIPENKIRIKKRIFKDTFKLHS